MPVQTPAPLSSSGFHENGMAPKIHPLEPLSAAEVALSVQLLKAHPVFSPTTRIVSIMLREPDKALVHAWPQGPLPERHAVAVLMDNGSNAASAVTLNLSTSKVIGVAQAPAGAQPTLSFDEQIECERAVLASPEFLAKLQEHYGISDSSLVMVDIWSAGNYGTEEDRTHRLARPLCFLRSDPTDNGYARPIEGIAPGGGSEHHAGPPGGRLWALAFATPIRQLRRRPGLAATGCRQASCHLLNRKVPALPLPAESSAGITGSSSLASTPGRG